MDFALRHADHPDAPRPIVVSDTVPDGVAAHVMPGTAGRGIAGIDLKPQTRVAVRLAPVPERVGADEIPSMRHRVPVVFLPVVVGLAVDELKVVPPAQKAVVAPGILESAV